MTHVWLGCSPARCAIWTCLSLRSLGSGPWTQALCQTVRPALFRLQRPTGCDDDDDDEYGTLRFDVACVRRLRIPDVHAQSAQCSRDGPDGQASSQYCVQAARAVGGPRRRDHPLGHAKSDRSRLLQGWRARAGLVWCHNRYWPSAAALRESQISEIVVMKSSILRTSVRRLYLLLPAAFYGQVSCLFRYCRSLALHTSPANPPPIGAESRDEP